MEGATVHVDDYEPTCSHGGSCIDPVTVTNVVGVGVFYGRLMKPQV